MGLILSLTFTISYLNKTSFAATFGNGSLESLNFPCNKCN